MKYDTREINVALASIDKRATEIREIMRTSLDNVALVYVLATTTAHVARRLIDAMGFHYCEFCGEQATNGCDLCDRRFCEECGSGGGDRDIGRGYEEAVPSICHECRQKETY